VSLLHQSSQTAAACHGCTEPMTRSQKLTAHLKAPRNPPPARPPDGALHHGHGAQRARCGKEAAKGGLAVHGHALPE